MGKDNSVCSCLREICVDTIVLSYICAMWEQDDLQSRWLVLENKLIQRFGKKPDMETLLFLIGIQELGQIAKFSKEQKQELMHVAVCRLLSASGYYKHEKTDEDGWPHYQPVKPVPKYTGVEQENFLKDHILLYFQENEF